jgi:hypothetical protein
MSLTLKAPFLPTAQSLRPPRIAAFSVGGLLPTSTRLRPLTSARTSESRHDARPLELPRASRPVLPINAVLVPYLDVLDLVRLTRVCKDLSAVYQGALKTQWDINTHLKPFFNDPLAVRQLQADTGALVTGQLAFDFFSRCRTDITNPFSIVVRPGENADAITTFLQSQSYALVQDLENDTIFPQYGLTKVGNSL